MADYTCDIELPQMANLVGYSSAENTDVVGIWSAGRTWGRFRLFDLAPYFAIDTSINQWVRDRSTVAQYNYFVWLNKSGFGETVQANQSCGYRPFGVII